MGKYALMLLGVFGACVAGGCSFAVTFAVCTIYSLNSNDNNNDDNNIQLENRGRSIDIHDNDNGFFVHPIRRVEYNMIGDKKDNNIDPMVIDDSSDYGSYSTTYSKI